MRTQTGHEVLPTGTGRGELELGGISIGTVVLANGGKDVDRLRRGEVKGWKVRKNRKTSRCSTCNRMQRWKQ